MLNSPPGGIGFGRGVANGQGSGGGIGGGVGSGGGSINPKLAMGPVSARFSVSNGPGLGMAFTAVGGKAPLPQVRS